MNQEQIVALKEVLQIDVSIIKARIICPLHNENTASADIDFGLQRFHCWGCGESSSLDKLVEKMVDIFDLPEILLNEENVSSKDVELDELFNQKESFLSESELYSLIFTLKESSVKGFVKLPKPLDQSFFYAKLEAFILKRKIKKEIYELFHKVEIDSDYKSKYYGYIKFYINEIDFNARLFIDELLVFGRPKYVNSGQLNKIFFGLDTCIDGEDRILVEGVYDWMTLKQLGFNNVICALGANISDDLIFTLRSYTGTTFLFLDNDYAGVKASNKILAFANKFDINIISLDLPLTTFNKCNDANSCLMNNKEDELKKWLLEQLDNYASNDVNYVTNLVLSPQPPLKSYSSGIETLDRILSGGFKQGLHAISATPGVGKTSFCVYLANHFYKAHNARVLYASYEISRLQLWARFFSIYSNSSWVELEENTNILEKELLDEVKNIAKNVRVVNNKDINIIIKLMDSFDILIIDYFQNMPSIIEDSDQRANLEYNLARLLKFSDDSGKVIIGINSLAKDNYKNTQLSFKGSGNIEYAVASSIILHKEDDTLIKGEVNKNRRGKFPEKFSLFADLPHCRFSDMSDNLME